MMTAPGATKRCPNCDATMNAGETCPECRHDERGDVLCECQHCEALRETETKLDLKSTDGFDEVRR